MGLWLFLCQWSCKENSPHIYIQDTKRLKIPSSLTSKWWISWRSPQAGEYISLSPSLLHSNSKCGLNNDLGVAITPQANFSRRRWQSTSLCLDLSWNTILDAMWISTWLSHYKFVGNCISSKKEHTRLHTMLLHWTKQLLCASYFSNWQDFHQERHCSGPSVRWSSSPPAQSKPVKASTRKYPLAR